MSLFVEHTILKLVARVATPIILGIFGYLLTTSWEKLDKAAVGVQLLVQKSGLHETKDDGREAYTLQRFGEHETRINALEATGVLVGGSRAAPVPPGR